MFNWKNVSWPTGVFLVMSLCVLVPGLEPATGAASPAASGADSERYTVLGFYDPSSFRGQEFVRRMKDVSTEVHSDAVVTLVDISQAESKALVERYGVTTVPVVVVVSPDGVVTGGVRGIPEPKDIQRYFVPRKMAWIIRAIQQNKVVLLALTAKGDDNEGTTSRSVETVHKIFRKSIETIELDTSNGDDSRVASTLGIDLGKGGTPAVVVLSSQGVVDYLRAPVSTKQLLVAFQRVLTSKSGCGGAAEGGLKSTCDE